MYLSQRLDEVFHRSTVARKTFPLSMFLHWGEGLLTGGANCAVVSESLQVLAKLALAA